jgi:hypothetical protein
MNQRLIGKGFISLVQLSNNENIKLEIELVDGNNKKLSVKAVNNFKKLL